MSTDPSLPPNPHPPPADIDSGDCPNVQLHSDAWPSITISIRNMGPRGPLAISLCKHTPCKRACIFKLALWVLQWLVFHLDPDSRCKFVEEWSSNWCARCRVVCTKCKRLLRRMTKMQTPVIISTARKKNTKVTTCTCQSRHKLKVFVFLPGSRGTETSNQGGIISNMYGLNSTIVQSRPSVHKCIRYIKLYLLIGLHPINISWFQNWGCVVCSGGRTEYASGCEIEDVHNQLHKFKNC